MRQIFMMGGDINTSGFDLNNNSAFFTHYVHPETWAEDGARANVLPAAGRIIKQHFKLSGPPGDGEFVQFIPQKKLAGETSFSDTAPRRPIGDNADAQIYCYSVSFAAGDVATIDGDESSVDTNDVDTWWSTAWEGDNANEAICVGNISPAISNIFPADGARYYNTILGNDSWNNTESNRYYYAPLNGTIKSFYIFVDGTPDLFSGTGTVIFSIYKNGAEEASSQLTFTENDVEKSVTGLDIDFSVGDTLTISLVPSGDVDADSGDMSWGIMYSPENDGESMVGGGSSAALSTTQDTEQFFYANSIVEPATTEDSRKQLTCGDFKIKNFRVDLATAPGANQTREFRIRKNNADGNSVVTISGANTTGTDSSNIDSFVAGDFGDISATPTTATCAASAFRWSAVMYDVVVHKCFTPHVQII